MKGFMTKGFKVKRFIAILCTLTLMSCICTGCGKDKDADKNTTEQTTSQATNNTGNSGTSGSTGAADAFFNEYPEMSEMLKLTGKHHAVIEVEGYGTIAIELDADVAPITVANFIYLAQSGFYDGLTFHRIMEGFMIQGGDPEGNGYGGSEHLIKGEFSINGIENNISHTRGTISMARSGQSYDSASSQFFIVQADSTFLDGQYAAFGYVTEGMEVVDKICEDAEPTDDNGTIPADEQPIINSIIITD
ncbi:MAG: peptidylprolyl isomerase [Wujia sp.]